MAEHWVVTGANRGIGFELVRQLAARGDCVTASVRDAAKRAPPDALGAATLVFDTRDEAAIRAAAAGVAAPVDVLVANAGAFGPSRQEPRDFDFDGALDLFSVNALGPLRTAQAFLPQLKKAARPRIVFISSVMGAMAYEGAKALAYRASKAALNKLMQGLAYDLKPESVIVVALHPGWVRTDMGGQEAPLAPAESAAGLLQVIDGLTMAQTGGFFDYQNSRMAW